MSSGRQTCRSWGLPGDPGWVPVLPARGQPTVTMQTSISGARLPWAPSPQVNLVSSDQVRGQQDLGGLGMGVRASKEVGCVFVEKKQQKRSYAAGTWISGASTPQSPCPWGVSPLQHCLGLRQFPESVQPHRALSKAGSWSNGVLPLDLPEPLEMSQLRPEGRTGAGWAGGNVGRA